MTRGLEFIKKSPAEMPRWDSHQGCHTRWDPHRGCALGGDPTRGRAHPVGTPPVLRTRWRSHRGRVPHWCRGPCVNPTGVVCPVGVPPVPLWVPHPRWDSHRCSISEKEKKIYDRNKCIPDGLRLRWAPTPVGFVSDGTKPRWDIHPFAQPL
ncbi:hypothetical protein Taro_049089 [Colocasia esculenta]|uniref:Uncharacterized protein n=1 Tax=Colocasia esculenta TaxID=4460 RepID=A0A843X9X9_COLES|nr:hypothetical protein [Colocasia esculenta]